MFGRSPLEQIYYNGMLAGKVFLDHFSYRAQYDTLASTETETQNVPINADSDFVIQEINLVSYSSAGTIVANPDYRITIVDGGSGRQLMDAAQHVANITGSSRNSGSRPYRLPMPKLIRAMSVVSITLQNLTTTAALVDVSLIGFKVFYQGGYSRLSLLGIN